MQGPPESTSIYFHDIYPLLNLNDIAGHALMSLASLLSLFYWLPLLISLTLSGSINDQLTLEELKNRINGITSRPTWLHKFTMPPSLLKRANTLVGDDQRMQSFVKKLIRGDQTKWAIIGSSISTTNRPPGIADQTWHGMFHRWLDLTFTPCGLLMDVTSVRSRQKNYTSELRRACNETTMQLIDLSLGASSSIWAEKCLMNPDKVGESKRSEGSNL